MKPLFLSLVRALLGAAADLKKIPSHVAIRFQRSLPPSPRSPQGGKRRKKTEVAESGKIKTKKKKKKKKKKRQLSISCLLFHSRLFSYPTSPFSQVPSLLPAPLTTSNHGRRPCYPVSVISYRARHCAKGSARTRQPRAESAELRLSIALSFSFDSTLFRLPTLFGRSKQLLFLS